VHHNPSEADRTNAKMLRDDEDDGGDEDLLILGVLVPLHHYLDVGGAPRATRLVRSAGNKKQIHTYAVHTEPYNVSQYEI